MVFILFSKNLYLRAKGPRFTKQLQQRKCNRMFFLIWRAPQGPAVHHLQNPFQVVIKQTCPLEFTIGDTGSWIAGGEPGEDPALYVLIVCIPNIRQVYPWRHGLPMDRWQGKVLVEKLDEQRIWLSDHCYLSASSASLAASITSTGYGPFKSVSIFGMTFLSPALPKR